jgi:hypothetical protein
MTEVSWPLLIGVSDHFVPFVVAATIVRACGRGLGYKGFGVGDGIKLARYGM